MNQRGGEDTLTNVIRALLEMKHILFLPNTDIIKDTLTVGQYSGAYPSVAISKYDCSIVYPEYLAQLDAKEYIDNSETGPQNLHRCEWAKACGVPWTSAGCS